ncbi:hypothetical protein Q9966_011279 [Columba livia]|nr:hypothetical protein Q9966_011279 [Columba livia]
MCGIHPSALQDFETGFYVSESLLSDSKANGILYISRGQDEEDNNRTSFTGPWREQLKRACEIAVMNSR